MQLVVIDNGNGNHIERVGGFRFETFIYVRDGLTIIFVVARKRVIDDEVSNSSVKTSSPRQSIDIWGITPHRQESH
ncbi:hypothetical protein ADILRU_0933 [Leifsonia rubra CMS 76R]|nr:hypothetical protein ADILRU_0933 [Leifsonia rubra CMS 76R]